MCYAFSENFVLPISHDEVVHGKKSLLDKMPGDIPTKFANLRTFLAFMFAHPGKKLNFMGSEYGQFKEWDYKEGLEFFLKDYPMHEKLSTFYKELNRFYKQTPALYEVDDGWQGFSWIDADLKDENLYSFIRRDISGEEIIAVINMSGEDREYYLKLPVGEYKVAFNSDKVRFGGYGKFRKTLYKSKKKKNGTTGVLIKIPKLSFIYLKKV
jgi:1,4-alpha-glucan branching enzyme